MSRTQSREVDRIAIEQFGISSLVLMENAGRGAAERICSLSDRDPIVILCGLGNNGGDGFVIARHLQMVGRKTQIFVLVPEGRRIRKDGPIAVGMESSPLGSMMSTDARANYEILLRLGHEIKAIHPVDVEAMRDAIDSAGIIVDAVLGTGARGPLESPMREAIELSNRSGALRVAIDLPTGLDCDSGNVVDVAFLANHTITFVSPKRGFAYDQGPRLVGKVHVLPIGIPMEPLYAAMKDREKE